MKFLKKPGVAWVITALMIIIAIGIASPADSTPTPGPAPTQSGSSQTAYYFVQDDAGILTNREEQELAGINERLYETMGVVVACVTTREGRKDIVDTALDYADRMGAMECDFIIVVDMKSEEYILLQGAGLTHLFTDADCQSYADYYMLDPLIDGKYGDAFLNLTNALADWYTDHYVG